MPHLKTRLAYRRKLVIEPLESRQLLTFTGPYLVGQYCEQFDSSSFGSDSGPAMNTSGETNSGDSARMQPMGAEFVSSFQRVVVDPGDGARLTTSRILGEWNTAGNFDGWSVSNAVSSSVANGQFSVTSLSSGNPLQISLQNIASGPYLDYGYFNYIQTRIQVPADFNQDIVFSFGTSTHSGFSSDRHFTIPAAQVAKDGLLHTYRIDLGLQVWWKDTLRDLQLEPLGNTATGQTAVIDYLEVGDLPNDTVTMTTASLNMAPGVTETSRQSVESKHFVFWYDPNVNPGGQTNWSTMAHNALHMMEECWQVYTKIEGYNDTTYWLGDGQRHKVAITTWYGGYWMGGPYMNVDSSGLQDEGPGNPVPHEYAHVTDGQQPGFLSGAHWESHANYHRESWVNWFSPYFAQQYGTQYQSTMGLGPLQWSNYRQDMPRLIYADYRIFTALQNYQPGLEAQLWTQGNLNWTVYEKLATILSPDQTVKDVVATAMSRWPMLDFRGGISGTDNGWGVGLGGNGGTVSAGSLIRADLWQSDTSKADYFYLTGSMLEPEPDGSSWWRVPLERAPEKYAYMYHWLTPSSTTVTVNLRGINTIDPTQDWRWCLQEIDANNNVLAYSNIWGPGQHTFTMTNVNNRLLLFVAATPGNTSEDPGTYFNFKSNTKNIDRLNYPYEVQITGATPTAGAAQQLGYTKGTGHIHSNGGGWVDNTASVASTAYVGPNARVLDYAQVSGTARIEDYAVISGSAKVQETASVSGYAVVKDSAIVKGNARVCDHATVADNSLVQGNGKVMESAYVIGNTIVQDSGIVCGNALPWGGTISGTAILGYDYSSDWSSSDGTHFGHFPWGGWFEPYYNSTQSKPRGLLASYRVDQPSGDLLWDEFGTEQAILRGSPAVVNDWVMNSKVLQLNGTSQYALLLRNLADLGDASYGFWVKPTSADANEALLYFGGSTGNYLKLTARDASGYAHLTINVGGTVKELVSTVAVPLNQWTHIALTFGGGIATFYINGAAAGNVSTTFKPSDIPGPDTKQNTDAYYIGRDNTGNYFTGCIEDMRFYNVTLAAAEVTNEMGRAGAKIGQFFATAPVTFDGSSTMMQSGVHNGLIRTLSASIRPHTSDDVGSYYEPVLDATDEVNGGGSGFGVNNGQFVVRLDGYGMWFTGVSVALNTWQQVAVTFDGTVAKLYVNGAKMATLSYYADPNYLPGKNYRIGYGQTAQDDPTSRTFFDSDIQNVQIYDRVVIHDPDTYNWDTSTTGDYQGGNGTWNTSTATWSNGDSTTLVLWPSGSTDKTAAFVTDNSGSNWTVTVSGTQSPSGIIFGDRLGLATDRYTVTGGTLSIGSSGIAAYLSGTINSNLILTALQSWVTNTGQTLTVGGNINIGGNALTISGDGTTTISGGFSGNGSLTKSGSGPLTLSGASSYSGGTWLNSGLITVLNSSGAALGTGTITIAGGVTLHLGNANATGSVGNVAIVNNGVLEFNRSDAFTEAGNISGTGTVTQFGPGTLTLSGQNTFGGDTRVVAGTLTIGNALALQKCTLNLASVDAGTANFGNGITAATLGGLAGNKALNLRTNDTSPAAVALTIGNNNQSTRYSGQLSGTGSLAKIGNGTLTLSAANTYSGGTTVTAGTLLVNNTTGSGLGAGTVNVGNGATLGGSGTISGLVTLASGATLSPSAGLISTFTVGSLQLAAGSIMNFELSGASADTIAVSNSAGLTINGGSIYLFQPGTTSAFATPGTYQLFTHTGTTGGSGVGSLNIANKVAGYRYSISDTGTAVVLTISQGPLWSGASGGFWSVPVNWSGATPVTGESLAYAANGTPGGTSVNDLTGASFASIVFNLGAAPFTLTGNKNLTLTGDYAGNIIQNDSNSTQTLAFPIVLGAGGLLNAAVGPIVLDAAGSIATVAGKTLTIKGAGNVTLNGIVTGAGGVTKSADAGTLILGNAGALGNGTFTILGGYIDNGTGNSLALSSNNAKTFGGSFTFLGSNDLDLGTGAVTTTADTTVRVNAHTLTINGNIGGGYLFNKDGLGTLVLKNGSTNIGWQAEMVWGGALVLDNYDINWTRGGWDHLLYGDSATTSLTLKNGSTFISSNPNLADDGRGGTLNIYDTSLFQTSDDLEVVRRGNGTLNQNGGTVEVGGNLAYHDWWNTNSFTGVYNLNAGTLLLHNGIVADSNVTTIFDFGGGMLRFSNNQTVSGFTKMAVYASGNTLGTGTATGGAVIDTGSSMITFNQALVNGNGSTDGGLTKTGAGTLVLTQANTYNGATVINAGSLLINNTTGSGTGLGAVTDNAVLGGTGTIGGSVTVTSSGTLTPGAGGVGTLTISGGLTLSGNTVMEISKSGTTLTCDKVQDGTSITYGGTLTVTSLGGTYAAGDAFTLFSATSYAGNFTTFNLPTLTSGLQWNLSQLKVNGSIQVVGSNAPMVAVPASSILTGDGKFATLSVLGNDNGGEANLTYTWSVNGPASVTYSRNGTNASKNTTATFTQTGTYVFTVTIKNAGNYTTTSTVTVTVNPIVQSITVMPASISLASHGSQTFAASGIDQFGAAFTISGVAWTAVSGAITTSGIYTAPFASGSDTVTATSGSYSSSASVTITNSAPTVATPASASPTTVAGTTTNLSVLGADDAGEGYLTYTWAATGPAAVNFSANGANAAKTATATFSKAGIYHFTVTIADTTGLQATSSVDVTVNQTIGSLTVVPSTLTADPNATVQFTVATADQFGVTVASPPVNWSASAGTIDPATGLFTAPASGPTTVTITAAGSSSNATAAVNILQPYGWWKIDENTGSTLNDSSGSARSGTLSGTAAWVAGRTGAANDHAMQLNGSNNVVTFSNSPSLNGTGDFSVSAWIKTSAVAAGVIIQQRGANSGQYQLATNASGAIRFWMRSSSSAYQFNLTTTQTVNDGQWHLVTGVRSGATGYVYIDGVQAVAGSSSSTLRSLSSTNNVAIGADAYSGNTYFNGVIDDVRIYASALSSATVVNMANHAPASLSLSNDSVPENQPIGTVVGTLSGTDPNAGQSSTLTFLLPNGYGDNRLFAIDPATKQLKTAAIFNYEAKSSYNLLVRAVDSSGLFLDQSFIVHVTDAAETLVVLPSDLPATGTANMTLALGSDGKLHVYRSGTETDIVPPQDPAKVTAVSITGRSSYDDVLTVDFSSGNPIPAGGASLNGGGGTGDGLIIGGTMNDDHVVMTAAQITVNGGATIDYQNVAVFTFALGGGTNSLLLDHATLTLAQDQAISAGTNVTVDGGMLNYGGYADAIGDLTVKNGGQVIATAINNASTLVQSGTLTASSIVCDSLVIGLASVASPSLDTSKVASGTVAETSKVSSMIASGIVPGNPAAAPTALDSETAINRPLVKEACIAAALVEADLPVAIASPLPHPEKRDSIAPEAVSVSPSLEQSTTTPLPAIVEIGLVDLHSPIQVSAIPADFSLHVLPGAPKMAEQLKDFIYRDWSDSFGFAKQPPAAPMEFGPNNRTPVLHSIIADYPDSFFTRDTELIVSKHFSKQQRRAEKAIDELHAKLLSID